MSLHYDKSELEIDNVDTPAPVHPMLLPFFTPAETMASPPEDDDNISLVSLTSASRRSAMPTSVHQDFPQVMTIAQRPPKPVSQGRVFTAHLTHPRRRSCHPPSLAFNSVQASSQQPLKTNFPVAYLVYFLRVQGHTEASYPLKRSLRPTCFLSILDGLRPGSQTHAGIIWV